MRALHLLLLRLPPELAHHVGIALLKVWQFLVFRILHRCILGPGPVVIPALGSLRFRSRLGLAAGFDKNGEVFAALGSLGFGFVEVGTVTPLPQQGNPKPRIWRVGGKGLRNRLGFNNVGLGQFQKNLSLYRAAVPGLPLFANLGKGKDTPNDGAIKDYALSAKVLRTHVDGFVVNLSSPNTPALRELQDAAFLENLAKALPPDVPVLIKFAPDLTDEELQKLCAVVDNQPLFCGVVVTNTSIRLARQYGGEGGVSGPELFARSLECVKIARSSLRPAKIVVGVGGVSTPEQARLMREAGADLVEIYTSFVYQGPGVIKALKKALD